jgi:hypothetical protein
MKRTSAFPMARLFRAGLLTALLASPTAGAWAASPDPATVEIFSNSLVWTPQPGTRYSGATLKIAFPSGDVQEHQFGSGDSLQIAIDGSYPDGAYLYELTFSPLLNEAAKKALAQARAKGSETGVVAKLKAAGQLPTEPMVMSGAFTVDNGAIVPPNLAE